MVGNFGEGAFALLLEPGVRHCGFLRRGSAATVEQVVLRIGSMGLGGSGGGKGGMFTEGSCLQLGVFG